MPKRLHKVNQALIAHSVPLLGCERIPIIVVTGIAFTPAVSTGFTHFNLDIISVVVFVAFWALARALYLHDQRSGQKLIDHLSWRFKYYAPHSPFAAKAKKMKTESRTQRLLRKLRAVTAKALRS